MTNKKVIGYKDEFGEVYAIRKGKRTSYLWEYIKSVYLGSNYKTVTEFVAGYFGATKGVTPGKTTLDNNTRGRSKEKESQEELTYEEARNKARKSKAKKWGEVMTKAESARIQIIEYLVRLVEE